MSARPLHMRESQAAVTLAACLETARRYDASAQAMTISSPPRPSSAGQDKLLGLLRFCALGCRLLSTQDSVGPRRYDVSAQALVVPALKPPNMQPQLRYGDCLEDDDDDETCDH